MKTAFVYIMLPEDRLGRQEGTNKYETYIITTMDYTL